MNKKNTFGSVVEDIRSLLVKNPDLSKSYGMYKDNRIVISIQVDTDHSVYAEIRGRRYLDGQRVSVEEQVYKSNYLETPLAAVLSLRELLLDKIKGITKSYKVVEFWRDANGIISKHTTNANYESATSFADDAKFNSPNTNAKLIQVIILDPITDMLVDSWNA